MRLGLALTLLGTLDATLQVACGALLACIALRPMALRYPGVRIREQSWRNRLYRFNANGA